MATLVYVPHMSVAIRGHPALFGVPVATMLAVADVPRAIQRGEEFRGFLSSCAAMVGLMALVGIGMFANLVTATDPARHLTIYSAASSPGTLRTMLVITMLGMPLVPGYTTTVYRVFRGKVKVGSLSY